MTRFATFFIIGIIFISGFSFGQQKAGKHHAKPTPSGVGKIDTRIDNMGYWREMAEKGYVEVTPYIPVPPAKYTSSQINSRGVLTTHNSSSSSILEDTQALLTCPSSTYCGLFLPPNIFILYAAADNFVRTWPRYWRGE